MSEALSICSLYSVFLPLLVGIIRYKKLGGAIRIVLLILVLAAGSHLATIVNDKKDLPVLFYNSYILAEAILWPLLFLKSTKDKKIKQWVVWVLLINTLPIITFFLFIASSFRFYYELVSYNSLLQILLVAFYFYELNNESRYVKLQQQQLFWVCIGLLYYASCTFFLFLFYPRLNAYYGVSDLHFLWDIHSFFNVLMYALFTIGLSITEKK